MNGDFAKVEKNFSFGFSFASTRNEPQNETIQRNVPVTGHKRPMPYIEVVSLTRPRVIPYTRGRVRRP